MKQKYLDIIPPDKIREMQKLSSESKRKNNVKRHLLALELYESEDINTVIQVFHVGRMQAYKMVRIGKKIRGDNE